MQKCEQYSMQHKKSGQRADQTYAAYSEVICIQKTFAISAVADRQHMLTTPAADAARDPGLSNITR